jgi:hypothetical protein
MTQYLRAFETWSTLLTALGYVAWAYPVQEPIYVSVTM